MKYLSLILSFLISSTVFAQSEDIYRLTFSDKDNFKLTTCLDHKLPKSFIVIDSTKTWNPKRFWLPDFDNNNKEMVVKKISKDEHHPYLNTYLFADTVLDKIFADKTKKELSEKSASIKSKHINLKNSSCKTVSTVKKITGFYFFTSEPLFSDNQQFAFIDITVFYKEDNKQPFNETYFGTIGIVFEKRNNVWTRIAKKDRLIL